MENFVNVTPDHPEVPPRNWDIHTLRDMEKCEDLESRPSHMLENTLFRGVFSNPWHLDQVDSDYGDEVQDTPQRLSMSTQRMGLESSSPYHFREYRCMATDI